jgi:hypothetical protein
MADLARVRVSWVGSAVVGESVSTFHCNVLSAAALLAGLSTYFNAIKTYIPDRVSVIIPPSGESIDSATGHLVGGWTATGGGTIVGTNGGAYTLGVGVRQVWNTAGIAGTKRVRGSTFIVPTGGSVFGLDGHVAPAAQTAITTAATALITTMGANFGVWSRPAASREDTVPPRPARSGSFHPITSATTPNVPSWLITRRT